MPGAKPAHVARQSASSAYGIAPPSPLLQVLRYASQYIWHSGDALPLWPPVLMSVVTVSVVSVSLAEVVVKASVTPAEVSSPVDALGAGHRPSMHARSPRHKPSCARR